MSRKFAKHCEGCLERIGARFRTLANTYLCTDCYRQFRTTGAIPEPDVRDPDPVPVRW